MFRIGYFTEVRNDFVQICTEIAQRDEIWKVCIPDNSLTHGNSLSVCPKKAIGRLGFATAASVE